MAGWRAAFIVPAALALACLPLVAALGPGPAADDRGPLDVGGALAAVGGLVLLLAGLSAIGQGGAGIPAWALLAGAAVALLAFVRIEARAESPLLPRGRFSDRRLAAGTLASGVNTAATSPLAVLGALYLQDVRGWSPAANGLSFVPFSVMVIVGSMAGATLLRRVGATRAFALALPCRSWRCRWSQRHQRRLGGGRAHRRAGGRRARAGHRRRQVATSLGGHPARPRTVAALAAGLINTAAQLGTAMSIALLVPLASAAGDTVTGVRLAFAVSAAIAAAGGVATLALLRRSG